MTNETNQTNDTNVQTFAWNDVPSDAMPALSGEVARQFIGGEKMTIARITFSAGAHLAAHKHNNEQFTMVLQGEMEFTVDGQTKTVREGEIVFLPSNSFHGAKANVASVVLDMFAPPRTDWGLPKTG